MSDRPRRRHSAQHDDHCYIEASGYPTLIRRIKEEHDGSILELELLDEDDLVTPLGEAMYVRMVPGGAERYAAIAAEWLREALEIDNAEIVTR